MLQELELGPRQRSTVAAAITMVATLVLVAVASGIVWGLGLFVNHFQNVLLPPVVAGILAMLLRPYYDWLLKVCRGVQAAALVLFFLSALLPLTAFSWIVGRFAISQLIQMFDDLPTMIANLRTAIQTHWPMVTGMLEKYGLMTEVNKVLENPGSMVANLLRYWGVRTSQGFLHVFLSAAGMFAWAVLPVYLAFFLMAKPFETSKIGEFLPFLKKQTREDVVYLFGQFVDILLTFFRGQIIVAFAQGVLFAIGFASVGLPYGVVIGISLGFLNIIPYLGSIAGLGVALPLAYFGEGGGVSRVVLVLVVFALVQAIEGYVLTPRIMGKRTGLHPALIIFAVFFWGVALGGILGMMLAIPLTAFAVVLWRLLKRKYLAEVV
jgi:predicted PurR-regulated permease PerM